MALVLAEAAALRARPDAARLIADRYGLAAVDVADWLRTTRWSADVGVEESDVEPVCQALALVGVLPRAVTAAECIGRGP
jgi:hypothetical protein